ncbi:hypothetical protein [Nocardia puris]|uniref:Uncharacterized protein n=1 Tax=Nocardia puris TaxID=208602 RepID=A0A366CW89_9NOCA|nr:hypothetical protein [Nocardia puris]RBO82083.1 hypothetical protein DFR74_12538 [Nocardia puris]
MQNITIGRYRHDTVIQWAGWIEGTREDGSTWILWLDDNGNPCVYFPHREPDGAVTGEPVRLAP